MYQAISTNTPLSTSPTSASASASASSSNTDVKKAFYKVDYSTKRNVFIRQVLFVGWFLLIFLFMVGVRCYVYEGTYSFGNWIMHIIAVTLGGFFLFLFIGLTGRNLILWKQFFQKSFTSDQERPF